MAIETIGELNLSHPKQYDWPIGEVAHNARERLAEIAGGLTRHRNQLINAVHRILPLSRVEADKYDPSQDTRRHYFNFKNNPQKYAVVIPAHPTVELFIHVREGGKGIAFKRSPKGVLIPYGFDVTEYATNGELDLDTIGYASELPPSEFMRLYWDETWTWARTQAESKNHQIHQYMDYVHDLFKETYERHYGAPMGKIRRDVPTQRNNSTSIKPSTPTPTVRQRPWWDIGPYQSPVTNTIDISPLALHTEPRTAINAFSAEELEQIRRDVQNGAISSRAIREAYWTLRSQKSLARGNAIMQTEQALENLALLIQPVLRFEEEASERRQWQRDESTDTNTLVFARALPIRQPTNPNIEPLPTPGKVVRGPWPEWDNPDDSDDTIDTGEDTPSSQIMGSPRTLQADNEFIATGDGQLRTSGPDFSGPEEQRIDPLQQASDDIGRVVREMSGLSQEEGQQRLELLKDWMMARGIFNLSHYTDFRYAYLALSQRERYDFNSWANISPSSF